MEVSLRILIAVAVVAVWREKQRLLAMLKPNDDETLQRSLTCP